MGKDPAVLFYTSDFLSGTIIFTDEQRGQYIRLLCEQHQLYPDHIPENHMISVCLSNDSPVIKKFIKDNDGKFFNKRMEFEIERRISFCNSRSNNKSGRKRKKSYDKSYENHMSLHMENENENRNENTIETETENYPIIPEYRECSELLKTRILERRQQKITETTLRQWDSDIRLMTLRDGRTVDDIKQLINECHDMEPSPTGFTWRNNILSMGKLRKQWNDGKIFIGMNSVSRKNSYGRQEYTKDDFNRQMKVIFGDDNG